MIGNSAKFYSRAIPILIGTLLLVRLIGMAVVPLLDTTEARYAEIGRKMAELNDWVTPWFDYGAPYWGKPPLAFWVTALSFKLFGVSEFTARLPHLIIALLIVALAAWLAARRDRDAAVPTVALMTAAALFFVSAGAVMTDIELILGTSMAMAGFWLALDGPDRPGRHRWHAALLFFGGCAVGLLAKGPVALVMTGVPLFLWTAYHWRWADVWRRLPWVPGVLLTLLVVLPWYWRAEQKTPGFLEYFLVGEHWHRFFTPGWEGDLYGNAHIFPIGSIWAFAFVDILPWSILLPWAAWRWRRGRDNAAAPATGSDERAWQSYLLVWALTPLLFFTAARNIIMTYVLPGLPAAAILAGGWLARQGRQGRAVDRLLSAGLLISLLLAFGVAIRNAPPGKLEEKTVKAMIAAYDQDRTRRAAVPDAQSPSSRVPLIFVGFRPFSGEFYSRGQAIKVADEEEGWRRIGSNAAYVATRSGDYFMVSAARQGKAADAITRVGRYGEYDLFFVAPR
jgi:4-amino-4-deoxy-L-arabinose transferase-like glycosyltransferase